MRTLHRMRVLDRVLGPGECRPAPQAHQRLGAPRVPAPVQRCFARQWPDWAQLAAGDARPGAALGGHLHQRADGQRRRQPAATGRRRGRSSSSHCSLRCCTAGPEPAQRPQAAARNRAHGLLLSGGSHGFFPKRRAAADHQDARASSCATSSFRTSRRSSAPACCARSCTASCRPRRSRRGSTPPTCRPRSAAPGSIP